MPWPLKAAQAALAVVQSQRDPGLAPPGGGTGFADLQVRAGVNPRDVLANNQLTAARKLDLMQYLHEEETMGFNLGAAIGAILPGVGAAIGGPLGRVIETVAPAVSAGFAPTPAAPVMSGVPSTIAAFMPRLPSPLPGPSVVPTPAMSRVPALIGAGRSVVAPILARASAAVGRRVTAKALIALARQVGIQAAATALGLSVTDIAHVIVTRPRRRRRGITAAQIATARRVIRFNKSLSKSLGTTSRRAPTRRHHHHPAA